MDLEWLERFVAEESGRVRRMLTTVIAAAGLTRQDVDRQLGRRAGTTSNVLTGRVSLKVEHVLGILLVCGLHPSRVYHILYPQHRPFGPIEPDAGDFDLPVVPAGPAGDRERASAPREPQPEEPPADALPKTRRELDELIRHDVSVAFAAYLEAREKAAKAKARKRKRRPAAKSSSPKRPGR